MHILLLGFDAFDPTTFERLCEKGRLPNLAAYVAGGRYAHFAVSNPPQTEVSWTSIATGLDPGGHGIFDFVHRDPHSYRPFLSLLPTKTGPVGTQFVPPHTARTIFEEATRQGFPATTLWWPATFPARPELPIHSLPGLGTPDVQGRWGVGTLFSSSAEATDLERKTAVVQLERRGSDRYAASIEGPIGKKGKGSQQSTIEMELVVVDGQTIRLEIQDRPVELTLGKWSPILDLAFKMGRFSKFRAITRAILTEVQPDIKLYMLPLQLHPLHTPWRYATPGSFVKQSWRRFGPFLTLGWPQDTTALEEGCIGTNQFLDLCNSVFQARERLFLHQVEQFEEGILAAVFDSLDRVQHMFRRDRPDIVDEWYVKLDALVGKVNRRLGSPGKGSTRLLVISDHGFSDFDYQVHLNRWLIDRGYLTVTQDTSQRGELGDVDWSKSLAYAVGLNSIYLNVAGREGQGSVLQDQREQLQHKISQELASWQGPDGREVVHHCTSGQDAFHGPFQQYGPDLVVGFSPGYRASAETGLGKWKETTIEPNNGHWGADHCVYSEAVPGVLFCNQGLTNFPDPSYRDIPAITLGMDLGPGRVSRPPTVGDEEEKIVEERLKGLGYL